MERGRITRYSNVCVPVLFSTPDKIISSSEYVIYSLLDWEFLTGNRRLVLWPLFVYSNSINHSHTKLLSSLIWMKKDDLPPWGTSNWRNGGSSRLVVLFMSDGKKDHEIFTPVLRQCSWSLHSNENNEIVKQQFLCVVVLCIFHSRMRCSAAHEELRVELLLLHVEKPGSWIPSTEDTLDMNDLAWEPRTGPGFTDLGMHGDQCQCLGNKVLQGFWDSSKHFGWKMF